MGTEMTPTDARRTMRKLAKTFALPDVDVERPGLTELVRWAGGVEKKE
jgi:hypothetical protein